MSNLSSQSGRSMIEMLGVLAIVGVLSVGALAGYSMAITNHRINTAKQEIRQYLLGILDLYANENTYEGINTTVLFNAGIFNGPNVFGEPLMVLPVTVAGKSMFSFHYSVAGAPKQACSEILLASWWEELGYRILHAKIQLI
ncbi:MAG: prepilin-type N-terminal cleavage/methylation domain-containing protein [Alphaproteobacteria bacterium]|nr:prepilin-type N-terminal cleavage/methylation domain-containing protein [Alphaproteobacteria bacterium]